MAADFRINLSGFGRIAKKIESMELLTKNKSELLSNIGVLVALQTKDRFRDKRDPAKNRWAPWSRKYGATRKSGKSLLVSRGDLENSIVWRVKGDKLLVGSDEIYAGTHQRGNPNKNIPKRAFLGINAENKKEIEDEILQYLEGIF